MPFFCADVADFMSRSLPPLNALRAFEAAARQLSFSKAAHELFVTQGAVSRQVRALEEHVGAALFRRRARAVELTDCGIALYHSVRDAFDELERAAIRAKGGDRNRVLTVSCLPTFAIKWLFPRLLSFAERHPGIEVHTVNSIDPVDFEGENVDVAIRVGRFDPTDDRALGPRIALTMVKEQRGLRAMRLVSDIPVPVCSPDFAARHGPFTSPSDFREELLVHMATRPNAWPDWFRAAGATQRPAPQHIYGHFFLAIDAAAQGNGIALIPHVLVEADIRTGRLVALLDRPIESSGAYYLICRSHQWDAPKIATFRDWIMAEARNSG
jgi:LysR family glycine cleavage system transcriptional activator